MQTLHVNDNIDLSQLDPFMPAQQSNACRNGNLTYHGHPLKIICGPIKITSYGIPPIDKKYISTDEHRKFISIPLDPKQRACRDLANHLEIMDKYLGSDDVKKKLFDLAANNYIYVPCIRKKIYKKSSYCDYCKMKLNVPTIIKNSQTNEHIDAKTIMDIAEHVRFLSIITCTFTYGNIFTITVPNIHYTYTYGISLYMDEITIGESIHKYIPPIYSLNQFKQIYKRYVDDHRKTTNKNITIIL